jgi:hypothetical protein
MALDEADKTAISEMISAAFTAGLEPIKKEFGRMANGAATTAAQSAVKGLRERLEALPDPETLGSLIEAKIGEKLPAKSDPAKSNEPSAEAAVAAAVKAAEGKWQKELAKVQEQLKIEAEEKRAITTKQQRTEEREALGRALEKAGVPPLVRPGALALLSERGIVSRDADGNIIYRGKDKHGVEETSPLDDGIAAWVTSDEGKGYLPPKDIGGSGDAKPGKNANRAGMKPGFYDPSAVIATLNKRS